MTELKTPSWIIILGLLGEHEGGLRKVDIVKKSNLTERIVDYNVSLMYKNGLLKKVYGRYVVRDECHFVAKHSKYFIEYFNSIKLEDGENA